MKGSNKCLPPVTCHLFIMTFADLQNAENFSSAFLTCVFFMFFFSNDQMDKVEYKNKKVKKQKTIQRAF